ncbi:hypothetical protein [Streptomyces sp. AHA2]|uniref:hypothetical protein n=1 Tax=Streptomyces sp. AHA2 TaxID=3064526 RepID=UPI002FE3D1E9
MTRDGRARGGGDRVRRLSDTEALFAHAHALTGAGRITTSFTVDGRFPPDRVERAVRRWAGRLPLLSLRIAGTGDELCFRSPATGHAPGDTVPGPGDGERLWGLRVGHGPSGATRFTLSLHPAIGDAHSAGRLVRLLLDALLGTPHTGSAGPDREALPPDTDDLTYEAGNGCACGGCGSPAPAPARRTAHPGAGRPYAQEEGRGEGAVSGGRADGAVTLALTARESRRLRDWCAQRRVTVGGYLTTVLADALARETGRSEVTVATAMSLRRRYAERALITEPGCVQTLVATRLRAGTRGEPLRWARAHAAALCSARRAWRPARCGHAAVRRAVERAALSRAPELRLVDAGCFDTVLGAHAARVTALHTVTGHGGGAPGGSLCLSTFKGGLTLALSPRGPGERWAALAERELRAAVLPQRALTTLVRVHG